MRKMSGRDVDLSFWANKSSVATLKKKNDVTKKQLQGAFGDRKSLFFPNLR